MLLIKTYILNPRCMTSLKIWFFSLQFNFFNHVLQNITLHCRVKRTEANCQSWRHCCGYSFQFSERARGDGKLQSGSQSETDAALLVASPTWASKIWPCVKRLILGLPPKEKQQHRLTQENMLKFWAVAICRKHRSRSLASNSLDAEAARLLY